MAKAKMSSVDHMMMRGEKIALPIGTRFNYKGGIMEVKAHHDDEEGKHIDTSEGVGKPAEEAEETLEEETGKEAMAGKIKGPGVPDGTGPHAGTPACPLTAAEEELLLCPGGKIRSKGRGRGLGPGPLVGPIVGSKKAVSDDNLLALAFADEADASVASEEGYTDRPAMDGAEDEFRRLSTAMEQDDIEKTLDNAAEAKKVELDKDATAPPQQQLEKDTSEDPDVLSFFDGLAEQDKADQMGVQTTAGKKKSPGKGDEHVASEYEGLAKLLDSL